LLPAVDAFTAFSMGIAPFLGRWLLASHLSLGQPGSVAPR
jgi:hypothetical protein